jgi:hypothetical protein
MFLLVAIFGQSEEHGKWGAFRCRLDDDEVSTIDQP